MTTANRRLVLVVSAMLLSAGLFACSSFAKSGRHIVNPGGCIVVEFDNALRSRVLSGLGKETALGRFHSSEFVSIQGRRDTNFALTGFTQEDWQDALGKGMKYEITGVSSRLRKTVAVVLYHEFPTMLLFDVSYQNISRDTLNVDGWTNNSYAISALKHGGTEPKFWSYQPGSYGWDSNWVLPMKRGFTRENYLGMNSVEYGGGTPVVDVWRPDCGIAVGHVALVPRAVSFPVNMRDDNEATLGITSSKKTAIPPGGKLTTLRTFVGVHKGDHYNSLSLYRQFMERQGMHFRNAPDDAYQNEWCSWGYEEHWTVEEVYHTLPKVKELGLEWVVLDMGWYNLLGDFHVNAERFPHGDVDIKKFVDSLHAMGLKVQLWWMPFAAALKSELLAEHPDYLLLNEDGSPQFMPMFFKAFFLCPASKDVQEFTRRQIIRLMSWGIDGFKIDGDNQNCAPFCYNPDHHHADPEESLEALPAFFRLVYETALSINPNAKIEICPCGTNQSFFLMPYMNETVASDPHTSWQVRLKGKTLKALTGSYSVFYGDHVELSDDKSDFASTIGVGGVIGTKFVYPPGIYMNTESGDVSLTPQKEAEWKKWITICNTNRLSRGIYRGDLYDIGFDRPEAHAVQKGDTMYFAFFAPRYTGKVVLRGLSSREYKVVDYENGSDLGVIHGPSAGIEVTFRQHLLLKAEPR